MSPNTPLHDSTVATLSDWEAPDAGQDALRHAVLAFLLARADACMRSCASGPITASALVVDHTGEHILLERAPGYWQGDAKIRQLLFRFVANTTTRINLLKAGEVHLVALLPWDQVREVAQVFRRLQRR